MEHYSKIIKDQIDRDIRDLQGFSDGEVYRNDVIKKDGKAVSVHYSISTIGEIEYNIELMQDDDDTLSYIEPEQVDELFTITVEEYIDFLQGKLCSYKAGINEDGYWHIETGDRGWMGFEDGQYFIAAYGNMHPCEILNELLPEHVTNHSKALKRWDDKQGEYILMD